jgi:hypothetical protein
MCPYYLDGDLTEPVGSVGDTRFATAAYRSRWLWLLCSFQGPSEKALGRPGRHEGRPAGTGLSKLNSMLGLELGGMPRDARRRGRSLTRDGGWAGQVRSTF